MEFGLLGPLLVDAGDGPLTIGAPKQRVLLAALLLQANKVVTAERLTELLWNGRPPATARTALQNHVMRLRGALGSAGADRLRTSGPGYLIEVRPGELDVDRFLTLREEGCRAAAAGQWSEARSLLGQALAQWRDDVLLDVPAELLRAEAGDHLAEQRAQTLSARIDADLALGGHETVVTEIRRLIERQPLNERPYGQLMLALYRSGRQADALSVFRDLRRLLVDELGIEPGRELTDLHHRMLGADPRLLPDHREPAAPAAAQAVTPAVAQATARTAQPARTERPPALPARPRRPGLGRPLAVVVPLVVFLLGGVAALQLFGADHRPPGATATAATATPLRLSSADGRVGYVARTGSDAAILTADGFDLPVLVPVTAGDTLIATLSLTGSTPGPVTVTDTAADSFTPVGDVTDAYGHRTLVFAAFHAKALGTADRISAAYPKAGKYQLAVDEFRGVGLAGGQADASSVYDRNATAFSTSASPLDCAAGDLLVSAVATNSGPAPVFAADWQTLPVLKLSSYRLTTAYRFVTTAGPCAATGTTTAQWEAVLVTLHRPA